MRERQPRLLVIWGKYDLSFELSEPEAYRRDVPNAEVHVLEAGHFARTRWRAKSLPSFAASSALRRASSTDRLETTSDRRCQWRRIVYDIRPCRRALWSEPFTSMFDDAETGGPPPSSTAA
jgi:hypothetical protein